MLERIIQYKETNKTVKEVYDEIAPDIIDQNMRNGWMDDTPNDIIFAVTEKYKLTQEENQELMDLVYGR